MLPRLAVLLPDVPVTLNSIMPMTLPGLPEAIEETNQQLAATAEESGCRYLDMTAPFTELCLPITRPCFLADGVHLSTLGYQVWAGEIARHIEDSC
jgi:lysophospholipase L1-like esterase